MFLFSCVFSAELRDIDFGGGGQGGRQIITTLWVPKVESMFENIFSDTMKSMVQYNDVQCE